MSRTSIFVFHSALRLAPPASFSNIFINFVRSTAFVLQRHNGIASAFKVYDGFSHEGRDGVGMLLL